MNNTLFELQKQVNEYLHKGYYKDVAEATKKAQDDTREFIYRTHPHGGFGDKIFTKDQFVSGKVKVEVNNFQNIVYANYFARWYNTGAYGRIIKYGKYKGRRATHYASRGNYFESNKTAIEDYFAGRVLFYMKEVVLNG